MRVQLSVLLLLFPVFAFAGLNEDFEALRDSGANYEVVGTVCEQVAKLRAQEVYQEPQYTVVTGIAYGDSKRTIGELDVIIFDNNTGDAVQIGEVKCWKNMRDGLKKARDQRARFLKTVSSGQQLFFESTDSDHQTYKKAQFSKTKNFISIAQKGSEAAGFDQELEYTLAELMKLRGMMMQCQKQGQCTRH